MKLSVKPLIRTFSGLAAASFILFWLSSGVSAPTTDQVFHKSRSKSNSSAWQMASALSRSKPTGVPLLVDDAAGFYLIGSATDIDDRNNIASFVKTTDGASPLHERRHQVSLPYSFTVEPTPKTKPNSPSKSPSAPPRCRSPR